MSATVDRDDQHVEGEESTELRRVMGPKLLLLFIVGDILGTGIYALTGQVAAEVGGAVWLPFLVAFVVAAHHRVQLPRAGDQVPAGRRRRALHAQGVRRALLHLPRRFTVMCSGITSASTASRAFAANLVDGFGLDGGTRRGDCGSRWRFICWSRWSTSAASARA